MSKKHTNLPHNNANENIFKKCKSDILVHKFLWFHFSLSFMCDSVQRVCVCFILRQLCYLSSPDHRCFYAAGPEIRSLYSRKQRPHIRQRTHLFTDGPHNKLIKSSTSPTLTSQLISQTSEKFNLSHLADDVIPNERRLIWPLNESSNLTCLLERQHIINTSADSDADGHVLQAPSPPPLTHANSITAKPNLDLSESGNG